MILHFMELSPPFKMFTLYKLVATSNTVDMVRICEAFRIKMNRILPPKLSDLFLSNKVASKNSEFMLKLHILRRYPLPMLHRNAVGR